MNQPLKRGYALLMVFASIVILAIANIVYTNHVQRVADQRWCPLLIIADRPNPSRPPQTPDELEARRTLHQLRLDLGCGGK